MNIKQVKDSWTLEKLLQQMGFTPDPRKSKGHDLWYGSPFRPSEAEPSFHIHAGHNIWNDFGLAESRSGGDMLFFVQRLLEEQGKPHSISDVLQWFRDLSGGSIVPLSPKALQRVAVVKEEAFKILSTKPIFSQALFDYLEERAISRTVAGRYLQQVYFLHRESGKKIYGLGFSNRKGGYDVRNPLGFKGAVGAKDVSYIPSKSPTETVDVFEGFFDFLSHITLNGGGEPEYDSIILNGNTLYESAAQIIKEQGHTDVRLWLDNDKGGEKGRAALVSEFDQEEKHLICFHPMHDHYKSYKDLNEWHQKEVSEPTNVFIFSFQ